MLTKLILCQILLVAATQASSIFILPNTTYGELIFFNPINDTTWTIFLEGGGAVTIELPVYDYVPWTRVISAQFEECQELQCPATEVKIEHLGEGQFEYEISLINGFNVIATVSSSEPGACAAVSCLTNINEICPLENQVVDSTGAVVACTSNPALFEESCPDVITTVDDSSTVVPCNSFNYTITFG